MTMSKRYYDLTNLRYCEILYNSFINERDRIIITRWRLSCHCLRIESGRYKKPVEDETHALFNFKAHEFIRLRYSALFEKYSTVPEILYPNSEKEANSIASYISEIEKNMSSLKMIDK